MRVGKETETDTTKFLWDGQNIVREYDGTSLTTAEYTLAPQPQPRPYGDLLSQHRDAESSFYHFDALGSAQALTDDSQVVTDQYTYEAFGKVAASTSTTDNAFTWVGEKGYYRDEESGQYALRRRNYDQATGRFVSEDPIGFEGGDANLFRYVRNNSPNAIDPSGEQGHRPTPAPETRAQTFPADRVEELVRQGLAYWSISQGKRYAAVIDATGSQLSAIVLQRKAPGGRTRIRPYYEMVQQTYLGPTDRDTLGNQTVAELLGRIQTQFNADRHIEHYLSLQELRSAEFKAGALEFMLHAVPFGAAADHALRGNPGEVALSLAGDVAFFLSGGLSVAGKATGAVAGGISKAVVRTTGRALPGVLTKSVDVGAKGARAALVLEAGIGVTRATQGIFALRDPENSQSAYGYFGEAFLRLIGVTAGAIAQYKKASKSTSAATSVPTGDAAQAPVAASSILDPQLDNNLLSHLANPKHPNHAAAVAYAEANKAAGLSVNRHAYQEFLRKYSKDQFADLKQKYGIQLIREISIEELDVVGKRLEKAFVGTDRVISPSDARIAASAMLRGERLATHDLQFFKRAKDLGLDVEFVGSGNAAANASNYAPRQVTY